MFSWVYTIHTAIFFFDNNLFYFEIRFELLDCLAQNFNYRVTTKIYNAVLKATFSLSN